MNNPDKSVLRGNAAIDDDNCSNDNDEGDDIATIFLWMPIVNVILNRIQKEMFEEQYKKLSCFTRLLMTKFLRR